MNQTINELLSKYQVRNTKKQKTAFIDWLENHSNEHGYVIERQKYSKKGENLIVGDVETADIILTAHYDTPNNMIIPGIISVGNIFQFIINQLWFGFLLIATIYLLSCLLVFLLHLFMNVLDFENIMTFGGIGNFSFLLTTLLFMVFPNRKNANDNTSGISVLISLLEKLSVEQRKKIAFVFFDEEEKMLIGSQKFKKKYGNEKTLINFDCVGNGKNILFIAKKAFIESEKNQLLALAIEKTNNDIYQTKIVKASAYVYTSDQFIFKKGVSAVTLNNKTPLLGYHLTRIHSIFDTKLDEKNIAMLTDIMLEFIKLNTSKT